MVLKSCTTYSEGAVHRATKLVCGAEHNLPITQMVHTKDLPAEPQGCLPELFKIDISPYKYPEGCTCTLPILTADLQPFCICMVQQMPMAALPSFLRHGARDFLDLYLSGPLN